MPGNFKRENREIPPTSQGTFFELWERSENAIGGTADVHVNGESDESIVPSMYKRWGHSLSNRVQTLERQRWGHSSAGERWGHSLLEEQGASISKIWRLVTQRPTQEDTEK